MIETYDSIGTRVFVRSRFATTWQTLPRLTVLTTLPGWGKTTWMHQCHGWLARHRPGVTLLWATNRAGLRETLSNAFDHETVIFIDDIVVASRDPLWEEMLRALERSSRLRLVVSSIDTPAFGAELDLSMAMLDEHALAFSQAEIDAFTPGAAVGVESAVLARSVALRGHPALVSRRMQRLMGRQESGRWTAPDVGAELHARQLIAEHPQGGEDSPVTIIRLLHLAFDFRDFDLGRLRAHAAEHLSDVSDREVSTVFHRLRATPFVREDSEDEFGTETLAWTLPIWLSLRASTHPTARAAALSRGYDRVLREGRIVGRLYYLLEMDRLDEAESLVRAELRRFVAYTIGPTAERLEEARPDPARHPTLALLLAELTVRRSGFTPAVRETVRSAFDALRFGDVGDIRSEFSRAALLCVAAVHHGNRTQALRLIDHMRNLLSGALAGLPQDRRDQDRRRLAGCMYLASRACMQVDAHVESAEFARLLIELTDPDDRLFPLEESCLPTNQDVLGLRSMRESDPVTESSVGSQAIAFMHLESGRDQQALDAMRPFSVPPGRAPRGSLMAGMSLLVRAISDHGDLDVHDVIEVVEESLEVWQDAPSTFLTFAAVVSCSAIGAPDEASWALGLIEDADDIYAHLARAYWALWSGDPDAAVAAVGFISRPDLPRFDVVAQLFGVAARMQLGDDARARELVCQLWSAHPHARLLRFALRLLPKPVADTIIGWRDDAPTSLCEALEAALDDHRPLQWDHHPKLTSSEADVLALLQGGLTNAAIAAKRDVSVATVHAELKSVYRKLGVSDRPQAINRASQYGLLQ